MCATNTRSTRDLLLSGCFAGWLAACSAHPPPPSAAAVPVTTATVAMRAVPVLATAVGSVEPINSVAVTSRIDGQLLTALVKDGAEVSAGQLLFRIDPRPAQVALDQARATQAKDQAALDQARAEVKRNTPIAAKGYISADQMQIYETALQSATAGVKVDQAAVDATRLSLDYTEIHAPISGRIGRILIQPGNLVTANASSPLLVINQLQPIYVDFALPGPLLGSVLTAQAQAPLAVSARVAGVAAPIAGTVAFIDNAIDTATGTIKLRAQFANADRQLWPGQLVDISLTVANDPHAIVVPDHAVQVGPDGTYVFVVKPDQHAEQRTVQVARSVGGESVIDQGLAAGETVVLDGASRVEDGALVKATDAPP